MKKIQLRKISRLCFGFREKVGRSKGEISSPRRGTLVKRSYRFLDTKRNIFSEKGIRLMKRYIYDPNRSAFISAIVFPNSVVAYILAPLYHPTQVFLYNLMKPPGHLDKGWSHYLCAIPRGSVVSNIEMSPGKGAQLVRAAGTSAVLIRVDRKFRGSVVVKLKSGEYRFLNKYAVASVGRVSNQEHYLQNLKNAGSSRLLGNRPRVRPSAMNPVDHPLGGRTKGGCPSKSRTGKLTLGRRTAAKKTHNFIFIKASIGKTKRVS
jgi:large subunit ribosomal protein L2